MERLLQRGTALAVLVERWTSHGLWVISRSDREYPSRYKSYLQHASPPVLFGVGEVSLLQRGGLAVVGSRSPSEEDLEFARRVGTQCASQQIAVISGAAKGIDSEAMQAVVDQDGRAVGVLAEGLARASVSSRYHDALLDGHLTLISPYEPDSRWFAYAAMDRNKLVYGLADAALVVSSGDETGGTWAGATEALRHKRISIYVRANGGSSDGNKKLIQAGARAFSDESLNNLTTLFQQSPVPAPLFEQSGQETAVPNEPNGKDISATTAERTEVILQPESKEIGLDVPLSKEHQPKIDPYEYVVKIIPMVLSEPQDEREFARVLHVVPTQAKAWLKRAVDDGIVHRLTKPVRYIADSARVSVFANQKRS